MNDMRRLLAIARGDEPADLVFKGGRIINVFTGKIETADVAVADGFIVGLGDYQGWVESDVSTAYIAPGLIDPHLHIESAMLTPAELSRVLAPRGTTALVADPHEIANVLGMKGIHYLIGASAGLPVDFYFMAPSCVPSTHLETTGAILGAKDLAPLMNEPRVLGLAEVMNYPGVIHGDPEVLEKIRLFSEKVIDGHAPLVSGKSLNAYALTGIGTEHEAVGAGEAMEKLARGMSVFIREGSSARNLEDLLPAVTDATWRRMCFCTDDRHPEDILEEGHLDHVLRRAIGLGLDPVRAFAMATWNPARTFGLRRVGAIAPGFRADLIILGSLEEVDVRQVYKGGEKVAENGELIVPLPAPDIPAWAGAVNMAPLTPELLEVRVEGPHIRVVEFIEGQLITGHGRCETPSRDGRLVADTDRDLLRLMVFERHQGSGRIGQGMVRGFGLKQGAMASSVAHDAHNIVAVGVEIRDILAAVETVKAMGGGLAVVREGRVLGRLPLPLAGLISDAPARETADAYLAVQSAARSLGCPLKAPFMSLSFLALPVIPRLKLTDLGLVDVERFELTSLFTD